MEAKTFFDLCDEFPTLAMLALEGNRVEAEEFVEYLEEELDLDTIMGIASNATKLQNSAAVRIGGEEAREADYAIGYRWPDGSCLILLFGTDQDPTDGILVDKAYDIS